MVKEEMYSETLVRHYSDEGLKIRQTETGIVYGEAIDVIPCRYTYEETDEPIEETEEATSEDYENALREVGVIHE